MTSYWVNVRPQRSYEDIDRLNTSYNRIMTVEDLISVANSNSGKDLQTLAQGKPFKVFVENDNPVFLAGPTGQVRKATNRRRLEKIVEQFNRTGSLRVADYKETGSRNLSYILKIIDLASDRSRD